MDPVALTLVAIASGMGLTTLVASVTGRHALARLWMDAGQAAGLTDLGLRTRGRWPLFAEGRRGTLPVRIESYYNWHARRTATRMVVGGLTTRLGLRASVPFVDGGPKPDIRVGDNAFDAEIFVTGEVRAATALLDARTRELVRNLFAQRVVARHDDVIDEKGVRFEAGTLVSDRILGDQPEWVASHLRDLLALAERLQEPDDLAPRLLVNLRDDPNPAVRRSNLLMLMEHLDRDVKRSALCIALEDQDEDVRLESAIGLGPEGHPALLAIATAEVPLDPNAARAVAELRSALPLDQARFVLARALRARHLRTAEACLESLSHRGPEQAHMIGRVLELEQGPLAAAAARALGRVGGTPAIVQLREAEARAPKDAQLRKAAREAVAAIRGRLTGADEGQVSLSGDDAGHVSLAKDEGGRVSLAKDDTGRVSLPGDATRKSST